jgi:cation:H+ antiporter
MRLFDFSTLPLLANLAIFVAAGTVVWLAGSRLARVVDEIGDRTHLSHAFLGLVLLGVATSLPELATTVTASVIGNAQLVTGNLFGGVALQIAVLAVVDVVALRRSLTFVSPKPVLLFQGVMLMLLLAIALAGAAIDEPLSLVNVGLTPLVLAAGYAATIHVARSGKYLPRWRPLGDAATGLDRATNARETPDAESKPTRSSNRVYTHAAAAAAVILAAGWVLALTGEALAEQTGLGASFVGVALVATSTSLPELSTSLTAVRRGNYEMAVSNVLGTNCLEVALFLVADVAYREGPILAATDASGMFAGAIGLIATGLLLLGLLERRNETVGRMGLDSLAILATYALGLAGLYHLR